VRARLQGPRADDELSMRFLAGRAQSTTRPAPIAVLNATNGVARSSLYTALRAAGQRSVSSPAAAHAVRDHWCTSLLPWTGPTEGLPLLRDRGAMGSGPTSEWDVRSNDIGTPPSSPPPPSTFTTAGDYLRNLSGVAVYAKDREDSTRSELEARRSGRVQAITSIPRWQQCCSTKMLADKARDQKIRDGINVYRKGTTIKPSRDGGRPWEQIKPRIDELQECTLAGWTQLPMGRRRRCGPLFVKGLAYASSRSPTRDELTQRWT